MATDSLQRHLQLTNGRCVGQQKTKVFEHGGHGGHEGKTSQMQSLAVRLYYSWILLSCSVGSQPSCSKGFSLCLQLRDPGLMLNFTSSVPRRAVISTTSPDTASVSRRCRSSTP